MGRDALDGFDLVRELRLRGVAALICVHSNRIIARDHKTAATAGADAFLPKPMARAQLLRLVLQAAGQHKLALAAPVESGHCGSSDLGTKPAVLIIDDNPFILECWQAKLASEALVYVMSSHEELVAKLTIDNEFLSGLTCIVTDMHFDGSLAEGATVTDLASADQHHESATRIKSWQCHPA